MVFDQIARAEHYYALHPLFQTAFEFLHTLDLAAIDQAAYEICPNKQLRAFIGSEPMRSAEAAKLEAHRHYIDIQIPLSSSEGYGWRPTQELSQSVAGYQPERDVEFFHDRPSAHIHVRPGEFLILFPEDAHAPLIGNETEIKKLVFKIAVNPSSTDCKEHS